MRQRRQVARCADRTLGGNGRGDAGVVDGDQGVDDQWTHARKAARQAADFHQHDQAHYRVRQQLAGADRMRQDQVALQFFQLFVRDAGLGQDAKTGVDAVGGVTLGHDRVDRCGRSLDDRVGRSRQRQFGRRGPDGAQVVHGHQTRVQGPAGVVRVLHII